MSRHHAPREADAIDFDMCGEPITPRISRREWITMIAIGLTGYYAASFLDFIGLQYVSAGIGRLGLTAAIAAAAVWLGAGSAAAQTKVRFQMDFVPQGLYSGFFYAKVKGYYAEEKLDVEMIDGKVPERVGNAHQLMAPYESFRTASREMVVAITTQKRFEKLCTLAEFAHLRDRPEYSTVIVLGRQIIGQHIDLLVRHLERRSDAACSMLIPFAPVPRNGIVRLQVSVQDQPITGNLDLLSPHGHDARHPHLLFVAEKDHITAGRWRMPVSPAVDKTPLTVVYRGLHAVAMDLHGFHKNSQDRDEDTETDRAEQQPSSVAEPAHKLSCGKDRVRCSITAGNSRNERGDVITSSPQHHTSPSCFIQSTPV